jgi:uncharacterized repeat protein (TIGR01451 family)
LDTNTITNGLCPTIEGPAIFVRKTASRLNLSSPGPVTFTYTVTNPGTVDLIDVTVTDDKLSTVTYVSGDTNSDHILRPGETWIYTAVTTLHSTTTNTATATGSAGEATVTSTSVVRVVIGRSTPGGALLPTTATPWYNVLLAGAVLMLLGMAGVCAAPRKIRE